MVEVSKVVAKWMQIRVKDKVMVWKFYNDGEEAFGSRGVKLTDDELNELMKLPFEMLYDAKTNGVEVKDNPDTILEKIVKRAYDEYLQAKKIEEENKENIIEM